MSAKTSHLNKGSATNPGNLAWQQESSFSGALPTRWMTMTYDGADRLSNQAEIEQSGLEVNTAYLYGDGANNCTSMIVTGGSEQGTTSYSYSVDNQLTGWSGPLGTGTYSYDADGSRTSGTDTQPGSSYVAAYGYDGANRLVSVSQNGTSYQYAYDYRSRRVGRTEGGIGTTVTYSGGTSLAEYTNNAPAGTPTVLYIRGSDMGGGIGGILYTLRNGGTQMGVTHYNGRGDVVAKTDQSGNLSFAASYDAFGKQTQDYGSTLDRQTANTKDQDPTGLINDGMRYSCLDGGLRVFITKDPAGFVDGPNVYTYVMQNPWTKFDPLGLRDETDEEKQAVSKMQAIHDNVMKQAQSDEDAAAKAKKNGDTKGEQAAETSARAEKERSAGLADAISQIQKLIKNSPDQAHDPSSLRGLDQSFYMWNHLQDKYTEAAKGGTRTGDVFEGQDKCNIALYDILVGAHIVDPKYITSDRGHPASAGSYNRGEDIPGLGPAEAQSWPHTYDTQGNDTGNWSGRTPVAGDVVTYGETDQDAHATLSLGGGWHIGASELHGDDAYGQNPGININTDAFDHSYDSGGGFENRMVRSPQ